MAVCSKNDVVLVRYPFSDLSGSKVRPAVVVSVAHPSRDVFVTPLTSRTDRLLAGEFVLGDWPKAGLNVPTATKRGLYTVHEGLIVRTVGALGKHDAQRLNEALREWLGL